MGGQPMKEDVDKNRIPKLELKWSPKEDAIAITHSSSHQCYMQRSKDPSQFKMIIKEFVPRELQKYFKHHKKVQHPRESQD